MITEEKIYQFAHKVGIKIDAFGCPVVDKKQMLVDLVREVEKEISVLELQRQVGLVETKRLPKRKAK